MLNTTRTEAGDLWLRLCNEPVAPSRGTLLCLPHAGGTANAYAGWPQYLPPQMTIYGVQYPGRQDRFGERPASGIAAMARMIATAAYRHVNDRPLTIFGHSMGAYVAYELCVELEKRYGPVVDLLVVSGVIAPHRKTPTELYKLPDAEFTAEVAQSNEAFADLLRSPDLIEVILPMIRDDYRLFDLYQPIDPTPVRARLLATGGETDPGVDAEGLASWSDLTTNGFDLAIFPGGHFYLEDNLAALVGSIAGRVPV